MSGEWLPTDREIREVGSSARFKGDQSHSFAAKPGRAGCDGGLAGACSDNSKGIANGTIGNGENESGVDVRRAYGSNDQRNVRGTVRARGLSLNLGQTINARLALSDGAAVQKRLDDGGIGLTDGADDCAITGAAAKSALQSLFDLRFFQLVQAPMPRPSSWLKPCSSASVDRSIKSSRNMAPTAE